jgi:hypothetical protein
MTTEAPRKPWYLVVALLTCLIGFGFYSSSAAWEAVERYRGVQFEQPAADLKHDDHRKAVAAAYDHWYAVLQTERPRGFPMSVAELVLGLAVFFFSSAAWAGRGGARRALVQLTVVQGAVVIATFVLTHGSQAAKLAWTLAYTSSKAIESGQPQAQVEQTLPFTRVIFEGLAIGVLVVRSVLAGLVVVALTRPGARAYYEPRDERPNES